jgi:cell division protein FtsQ
MHQRKGKKIIIYLILLISVGSINNIELNKIKFSEIKNIKVSGLDSKSNIILLDNIKNLNLDNIFFINGKEINNIINSSNLIEKYNIFKKYPSSLDINIEKTKFLAKINKNGKILIVGSNGRLSENNFNNKSLPFIFGKINIEEFLKFKKIIDQSKFSYEDIKNLYFFSSKRWDLELNNNMIIKISKNNIEESLMYAYEFIKNQNLKDIRIIDLRVANQIIIND